MNMTIYETMPFVFSSINVWLILRNEITPKFELRLKNNYEQNGQHNPQLFFAILLDGVARMPCSGLECSMC